MSDWGTPERRENGGEQDSPNYPPPASEAARPVPVSPAATSSGAVSHSPDDAMRALARKRLKQKNDFRGTLTGWLGVSALTTVIWAVTGGDYYFWPIWPILGVGIGVVSQAATIWGPGKRDITEADIESELRRLRKPR